MALHATSAFVRPLTVLVLVMVIPACMGYTPGLQAHWDAKLKEMCELDGGITVFERVTLTEEQYRRFGGRAGGISLPSQRSAPPGYPFATRTTEVVLNERDPKVYKAETDYLRLTDGKVLAKLVRYWRVGGDFPTFGHPSSYSCPDQQQAVESERGIFILDIGKWE